MRCLKLRCAPLASWLDVCQQRLQRNNRSMERIDELIHSASACKQVVSMLTQVVVDPKDPGGMPSWDVSHPLKLTKCLLHNAAGLFGLGLTKLCLKPGMFLQRSKHPPSSLGPCTARMRLRGTRC